MRVLDGPVFRLVIFPMLFAYSSLWFLAAFRLLAVPAYITVVLLYLLKPRRCQTAWAGVAWLALIGITLLPIDLSFQNYPGPPRFVRLVMGRPTEETVERAKLGEFMLGGCVVSGYEPQWVWVW
jgi:hypothetical protein